MLHPGKLTLLTDLFRGPTGRAKVRDRLAAARLARQWGERHREKHKPSVGIALVEHLGDIVAAEPVLAPLRERHPDAELTWVVREPYRDLVEHHPLLDSVLTVRSLGEWLMLKPKRPFDVVYDLHVTGRQDPRTFATVERDGSSAGVNASNYYEHGCLLDIAAGYAGVEPREREPRLYPPPGAVARVDALGLPERFVVVHARSNQPSRDWDDAKWPPLLRRLRERLGLACVEVGLAAAVRGVDEGYTNLCARLSVGETAEVMRRAAVGGAERGGGLFIGIDSGPAHLANAAGVPGVILMGRYEQYTRHMPFSGGYADGSLGTVLRAGGGGGAAAELSVEAVFAAAAARVLPQMNADERR